MSTVNRVFQVDGKPFFPVGGQTHNSSGYNAAEMEQAWKALEAMHANSFAVPVYWAQVEPVEGQFDFSGFDSILSGARERGLRIAVLWFASWKNGKSRYSPSWVKRDGERFVRVQRPDGKSIMVLSPHCAETQAADKKAFCEFMRWLRDKDEEQGTVYAVQVENEPGILSSDRDYGPLGEAAYRSPVPDALLDFLETWHDGAPAQDWQAQGKPRAADWEATFGWHGGEYCTAYAIANYIDDIAAAGKAIYNIPMYVNVWLGEFDRMLTAGNYPAGGAVLRTLDVWKSCTPHLDLIAPDNYMQHSEGYVLECEGYNRADNALYIPESAPRGPNARQMFYAVGNHACIGFHIFGLESTVDADGQPKPEALDLVQSLQCLRSAAPLLLQYQGTDKVHAIAQEENHGHQLLDLGDYLGLVDFEGDPTDWSWQDWRHGSLNTSVAEQRGRGLLFQTADDEFMMVGAAYRVLFIKKAEPAMMLSGAILDDGLLTRLTNNEVVQEGHIDDKGNYVATRHRCGDETDFGAWVQPDCGVVRVVMVD